LSDKTSLVNCWENPPQLSATPVHAPLLPRPSTLQPRPSMRRSPFCEKDSVCRPASQCRRAIFFGGASKPLALSSLATFGAQEVLAVCSRCHRQLVTSSWVLERSLPPSVIAHGGDRRYSALQMREELSIHFPSLSPLCFSGQYWSIGLRTARASILARGGMREGE
jgi:hypothetical protein